MIEFDVVLSGFYCFSSCFTGFFNLFFFQVLPSKSDLPSLPSFTSYWVWLCFTRFLLDYTEFDRVLWSFSGFYWVLPGLT